MSSMSSFWSVAGATAAVIGLSLVAAPIADAQGKPDQQIKYRQAVYTVIGANFAPLGAVASGRAPFDAARVRAQAERVAFMATITPELFPAGSGAGAPTSAKPEIWQNRADFDKLMKDMQDKTAALSTAARTAKSADDVKAAFGAAAQTCKACHDKYKVD